MIVTDAPIKPKTPGSLKCTYCGCVHRLSDLKSTANCPNCAGNKMVSVGTNEPFDLQAHLDRRKRHMALWRHFRYGTEFGGPK